MKVFLHIGAGKTGTSAIQVALARSREALAGAGIVYPDVPEGTDDRAARGEISSGNARGLGWLCNSNLPGRGFTREGVRHWVEASMAEAAGRHLLYSSESLQNARPEEVPALLQIFQDAGYAPQVIFYVRHVLDHAVAEYLQHVKMGFATLAIRDRVDSLDSFLLQYRCRYGRSLNAFAAHLPREAVHVRLYDAERAQLVPNFFALLGVPMPPGTERSEAIINRSPSPEELLLFERVAREADGLRLCRRLTDLLLNAPAPAAARFVVSEATFSALQQRNQAVVDEINATWLNGAASLRTASDRVVIGPTPTPSIEAVTASYGSILAAVLRGQGPQRGRAANAAEGEPREGRSTRRG